MKTTFSLISLAAVTIMLMFCLSCFYSYFYPMKFCQQITTYSQQFGLDGALIASVVNAESSFDENAKSSKGAVGLMQLMPSTAKWVAEKLGEEFHEEKLCQGQYNLKLGSFYLAYLIKSFGDEKLGLCAYNAGPKNVRLWLENSKYSQDGKSLLVIPFEETRQYLNKVYKNYNYYSKKYKALETASR